MNYRYLRELAESITPPTLFRICGNPVAQNLFNRGGGVASRGSEWSSLSHCIGVLRRN